MSSASSEETETQQEQPSVVPPESARSKRRMSRKQRDATLGHAAINSDRSDADNEFDCAGDEEYASQRSCSSVSVAARHAARLQLAQRRSGTSALAAPLVKNKSFSSFEVREIERQNRILIERIDGYTRKPSQYRVEPARMASCAKVKASNSQVNRKKKQLQIDRENMLLLKKIQCVKPFGLSKRK